MLVDRARQVRLLELVRQILELQGGEAGWCPGEKAVQRHRALGGIIEIGRQSLGTQPVAEQRYVPRPGLVLGPQGVTPAMWPSRSRQAMSFAAKKPRTVGRSCVEIVASAWAG